MAATGTDFANKDSVYVLRDGLVLIVAKKLTSLQISSTRSLLSTVLKLSCLSIEKDYTWENVMNLPFHPNNQWMST